MSDLTLEERMTKLEHRVDQVIQKVDMKVDMPPHKKDWRRTVGMFDDDPIMEAIIEEGKRIRDEDRRAAE